MIMLLLLNVLLCLVPIIIAEPFRKVVKTRYPRVIDGHIAKMEHFSYIVRIDEKSSGFSCGGSIITKTAILTAAHCVIAKDLKVYVGIDKSQLKTATPVIVDKVVGHPNYDERSMRHDLAVILLKGSLSYESTVNNIEMATSNGLFPQNATIVGWGCRACIWFIPIWMCQIFPSSDQLRFGLLELEAKEGHILVSNSRIKSCPGDSGGPVVDMTGKLIGIISHMDVHFLKNRPNYFTSIPDHLQWINEVISNHKNVKKAI